MKKVFLWSLVAVLVIILGVGVYWAYWLWPAPPVEREAPVVIATVERGAIQRSVKALGYVTTRPQTVLSFGTSGVVVQVMAQEGDRVEAGQVLAQLDAVDANLGIQQAEAGLRAARAQLAKVEAGATEADLAAAEAALVSAQAQYDELAQGPLASEYAAAQAALRSARTSYAELIDTTKDTEAIEKARLAWEQAKNDLWYVQAERDAVAGRSGTSDAMKDQLQATVNSAELNVQIAELAYRQAQEGPTGEAIDAAKARIASAEAAVERLAAGTDTKVKIAAAQVAGAQAALDTLKRMPTEELVETALAGVAQAEAALETARRRVTLSQLASPSAGTVTQLSINPGLAMVASAPAIVISHYENPPVLVMVNEAQINDVAVGQAVHLALDAIPDRVFDGQVSRIDPGAGSGYAMNQYEVTVELDDAQGVLPGMLAEAQIIAAEHGDILFVPRAALRWNADQWLVTTWDRRLRGEAAVTVGIRNATQAEIISGLEEGDQVIIEPAPISTGQGTLAFTLPGDATQGAAR